MRWWWGAALVADCLIASRFASSVAAASLSAPADEPVIALLTPTPNLPPRVWVPIARRPDACQAIAGASYADTLASGYPVGDPPAAQHPDLNLSLRGWARNNSAYLGLVDYNGSTDGKAPQLTGLFGDSRAPTFVAGYRVYDWNWATNRRGALLTAYPVTLAGLAATPGELVRVPASGYTLGQGVEVLVLYADQDSITLKYTREDNVISGYTLHLEGLCVEPRLLALYEANNAAGRARLPGLTEWQALGRARGTEVQVAIRDNGTFMDPRSRKDWWQSVSQAAAQLSAVRHDVAGQP